MRRNRTVREARQVPVDGDLSDSYALSLDKADAVS